MATMATAGGARAGDARLARAASAPAVPAPPPSARCASRPVGAWPAVYAVAEPPIAGCSRWRIMGARLQNEDCPTLTAIRARRRSVRHGAPRAGLIAARRARRRHRRGVAQPSPARWALRRVGSASGAGVKNWMSTSASRRRAVRHPPDGAAKITAAALLQRAPRSRADARAVDRARNRTAAIASASVGSTGQPASRAQGLARRAAHGALRLLAPSC